MTEAEKEAQKQGQASSSNTRTEKEPASITPEKLQTDTRGMMQTTSKAIANELTAPVAQMVGDQLAYNVLQKLPDIVDYAGSTIKDFMSGALSTETLMSANPMTPYLKMAGIED